MGEPPTYARALTELVSKLADGCLSVRHVFAPRTFMVIMGGGRVGTPRVLVRTPTVRQAPRAGQYLRTRDCCDEAYAKAPLGTTAT
jgi:hypothetical protein